MSNRVSGSALKSAVAIVSVIAGTAALSGCTALGGRAFGDPVTTGSVGSAPQSNLNQSMPSQLGVQRVANGRFIPPENVGGGGEGGYYQQPAGNGFSTGPVSMPPSNAPMSTISTQDLPVLSSSKSSIGTQNTMSAQPNLAPVTVGPKTALPATPPSAAPSSAPSLVAVPSNAYVHVIAGGESLYTIARRYDVTTQAIVQANGFSSPDKISVGQKIIIPGRPDLLASKGPGTITTTDNATQSPVVTTASVATPAGKPAISNANLLKTPEAQPVATQQQAQPPRQPAQVASLGEPKVSGAEKFRWPVSGRVITDFSSSKGTGINIEAPEGAAIRAAENGTVIYVGSGVEGYGNLVLIRHANGYVSAYAHLKSMSVAKGAVVNRGDNIGTAGMTGSVKRPQLHFELRKGATPVDPMPLLAS
jgi:murein DD-endopeptidase MepM/ murein hydrolase activator NlpD